jgi:hypothetical protein
MALGKYEFLWIIQGRVHRTREDGMLGSIVDVVLAVATNVRQSIEVML